MKVEKPKISIKNDKPKPPKTIKDIEDTLKEMDKIHNTSFYNWIKDENNASVIAFKTKELFHENYEKQPELVYNALRFLCKDWKLSKIAELILKLFYKSNVASEKLAIIIYEVSLMLENPEKVDLISLLLIGEEPKNVAFFLYHFFKYTEKKYREHTEILNEEEFLDEMNAFCSGILECLYTCLKWNNDYFRELILEYITLSTIEIDARREFLVRMVNVKYSRFQQELLNRKESILSKDMKFNQNTDNTKNVNDSHNIPRKNSIEKIEESEEIFKRSLNFGILVFNMYQVVMRTEIDDLLAVTSPTTKEVPTSGELTRDKTMNMDDIEFSDNSLSDNSMSFCSSKRISLKSGDEEDIMVKNHEEERMKKEESSATLWVDDENENITMEENYDNSEMSISKEYSMSSVYNFGYDSSFCKNDTTTIEQEEEPTTSDNSDEFSYHFEELFNESIIIENTEDAEGENTTEIDLLDDFINKSFTSNPSSRRNSMLSLCSIINDYNLEDGGNIRNVNTTIMESHSSSNRRNSRYSLNLSIHSMPCLNNNNGNDGNSSNTNHCGCNCTRYNNYSDNLLNVFPSPASSPILLTPPASPTFLLNDHDYDPTENPNPSEKYSPSPIMSEEIREDDYAIHNNSFINFNESCCCQPSPTLNSPNTPMNSSTSHLYRQFSPELMSPSPIVQSLSADNIYVNSYGYSCTFNHVNSTPTLQNAQIVSSQNIRDN